MSEHKPIFPTVSVNGTVIPETAIASEAQNHPAPKGKPGLAWRAAARALVLRQLLLDEAALQSLAPDPAQLGKGKRETDDEALIRAVLEAGVAPEAPSEDAIRAHWQAGPERFRAPPLWEVSHILCATNGDASLREAAKARAEMLLKRVQTKPADFPRIAAAESDCSSKSSGGMLGQLGPGDTVPEFEAALRSLEAEAITTSPVESQFGFHIIRMDAKAEGRVLPYEAARPIIEEAMEKAAWARAARDYVAGLAAKAQVVGVDLAA